LALLLVDNPLDSSRSKSRRFISRAQAAPLKEIAAILLLELLPAEALRLSQNGSDPLAGHRRALGKSLRVATVAIIFGIPTHPCPHRVEFDVSSHRRQGPSPIDQHTLKALSPQDPVASLTPVIPLGESAFELFDKDREVNIRLR